MSKEFKEGLIALTYALAALCALILVGFTASYYGDKAKCEETAELYGDTRWQYTAYLGCMIHHNGFWVSGDSLRDNTFRLEKDK